MNVKDYDNPIYDSQEDPLSKGPKIKGPGGMGGGRGVAASSDSFGGPNPMIHSSGGVHEAIKNAKNGKYGRNNRVEIREEGLLENYEDDWE